MTRSGRRSAAHNHVLCWRPRQTSRNISEERAAVITDRMALHLRHRQSLR